MSTDPDTGQAPAWDELPPAKRNKILRVVDEIDVDELEPEPVTSSRRQLLQALGLVGTGAALGGASGYYGAQPAAASHGGGGTIGTASNPLSMVHTHDISSLTSLTTDDATVNNAPTSSTDVARKTEVDAKADGTHASQHQSGGSDTLDAGTLGGSSGTNGQILQTDGTAATWADSSAGGGVGWTLDGTITFGSSSETHNLGSTYDYVRAIGGVTNNGGDTIHMQVNGLSSGYTYRSKDGTETTGNSYIRLTRGTDWSSTEFVNVDLRFQGKASSRLGGALLVGDSYSDTAQGWENGNASGDLSSITIFDRVGNSLNGQIDVYGRNDE